MLGVEVTLHVNQKEPLSEILRTLQQQHGVTLHRTNLAAKNLTGPNEQPESFLDQLARDGLAEAVEHGQRRLWYVSPSAIPRLLALARQARPGPAPGAQVTLDAAQLRVFAARLAHAADPVETLRDALAAATGWDDDVVARVERIVLPLAPRQGPSKNYPKTPE